MKDRLPQTVRLIEQDIYSPLPEDMVGKYDIVHVQMFLLCVKDNDPIPLIQKFIQLLKPGGYLHWAEVDPDANQTVKTVRSSSSTEATEELMEFLSKPREYKGFGWISQLESVLIQEGLAAVTVDRTPNAESYQGFWNTNFLMLGEEYSSLMLHGKPSAEVNQNATRLREATRRAAVEMQNGVAIHAELILA
ncbi:hypothetical protein MMC29_005735, partial [Sticta canariensis]|nr:hypothetical protein [Sticta canariensis]